MYHDYGESTEPADIALPTWADKCEHLAFLPGVHVLVPFPLLQPFLQLKQPSLLGDFQTEVMKILARNLNRRKGRKNIMIHAMNAL